MGLNIKTQRILAASSCGLVPDENLWKYNKKVDDDPLCPERFYCRIDQWKPDENWNQFMYLKNRVAKGDDKLILSEDTPKESFQLLMAKISD